MRVYCRVHDGENAKPRPSWYGKELTLTSLVRAARTAQAEVRWLVDGGLRPSLAALLDATGTVRSIPGGSARRSYRAMVAHAASHDEDAPGDELVWFSEDDYLYRPDALARAGEALRTGADYVTLAAAACLDTDAPRHRPRARPAAGANGDPAAVKLDGVTWFRAVATTSTFGVRRQVLREDARLLRLAPFAGGAWDTTTSLVLQGLAPFAPADLTDRVGSRVRGGTEPVIPEPGGASPRVLARAAVRAAVSTRALRRPSRRRVLLGSDPELARHLETDRADEPSPSTAAVDWEALAADTRAWSRARGDD